MEPRFKFNDDGVVTVSAFADDTVLDNSRAAVLNQYSLAVPLNLNRTIYVSATQNLEDAVDACLFAGAQIVVSPAAMRIYKSVRRCIEAESQCLK